MKITFVLICLSALLLFSCTGNREQVVVYCALDKIYAEPILQDFEQKTGIDVLPVYDTEITKTVGLVNRILAESNNPQCDVFWNNEISRTIMLVNEGRVQPYESPQAINIPAEYKNADGYWTGFAARARIIIYNKDICDPVNLPTSIVDLTDEHWHGKASLAYPLFGTTATHAAVLFSEFDDQWAVDFFRAVEANNVAILNGNATVRDRVVSGDYHWGFTDTDDANGAIEDGKNVGIIYPDQGADETGMLIIPNTIALMKNCPNPENGKKLIDFVLRPETEEILANSRSAQIPLRSGLQIPDKVIILDSVKQMKVDFENACRHLNSSAEILSEIFIK